MAPDARSGCSARTVRRPTPTAWRPTGITRRPASEHELTAGAGASISRTTAPGLALVAAISALAVLIGAAEERLFGRALVEPIVLALLLGVAVRNIWSSGRFYDATAAFAAKPLLEVAIVLLGAGVNVGALIAAGPTLAGLIVIGVTSALVVGFLAGRVLGLGPRLALLVATGNAICGNSAIAAIAPVIQAEKRDVVSAIALTAVLGLTVVLTLPLLIPLAGLTDYQYGVLAGMSVYAVPQALAAAFPVSQLSGEVATMVKLGRVMLLGPVVVTVGLISAAVGARRGQTRTRWSTYLPWFVLGFAGFALLRGIGLVPDALADQARAIGGWLTILAMAGLGLGVRLSSLREVGPRVMLAVVASLALLVTLTLIFIRVFGITG